MRAALHQEWQKEENVKKKWLEKWKDSHTVWKQNVGFHLGISLLYSLYFYYSTLFIFNHKVYTIHFIPTVEHEKLYKQTYTVSAVKCYLDFIKSLEESKYSRATLQSQKRSSTL